LFRSIDESAPPRVDGTAAEPEPAEPEVASTEIASCVTRTGNTSSGRQVSRGVSARRIGFVGYHATISPVFSEKRVFVVGHSMQKSWVSLASAKPSE